jgi:methylenetetrahydrofolate dehydrogenase (NADP+)/methenyltetrahydrofolate cyclohydrolase
VLAKIPLQKDVDDLNGMTNGILPPAPGSLKRILEELNFDLKGKRVIVYGPGFLIGRPIANWLTGKCLKLTVCDKGDSGLDALKEADLIVTCTGVPKLIRGEQIKQNAVMVDYGYATGADGKLTGDVDMDSCSLKTELITPTPGGTGPIVVAQLFQNFYHIAK